MSTLGHFKIEEKYICYHSDFTRVIDSQTISVAKHAVIEKVKSLPSSWTYKDQALTFKSFYIGKTHIREKKGTRFDPSNANTWNLNDGINGRYRDHVKQAYGNGGLLVLAVITRSSIPEACIDDGYIEHQEEYALTLERRLIQHYQSEKDKKLWNKGVETGKTDGGKSIAYAVYIAFSFGTPCFQNLCDCPNEEDKVNCTKCKEEFHLKCAAKFHKVDVSKFDAKSFECESCKPTKNCILISNLPK